MTVTTQAGFYLFEVNNKSDKNTRARCEMCLKLTVRAPEPLLLTFSSFTHSSGVFIGDFEQVNIGSVDELQNGIYFEPEH